MSQMKKKVAQSSLLTVKQHLPKCLISLLLSFLSFIPMTLLTISHNANTLFIEHNVGVKLCATDGTNLLFYRY